MFATNAVGDLLHNDDADADIWIWKGEKGGGSGEGVRGEGVLGGGGERIDRHNINNN